MPPRLLDDTGEVWVMLENKSPGQNIDVQLLLMNMGAHKLALQLLNLPFTTHTICQDELDVRAVLRAAYRMIKAMTAGSHYRPHAARV